ncbi:MAG: hypothetical protein GY723_09275 [bacterium]|nr:hypothetical protein [bacterium]MCP5069899.1 hypothetical protein [bacterium]
MAHRHPFRSPPPPVLGLAMLGILLVAAYPFALEWALLRFGLRTVAVALLVSGAAGLAWRWRSITAPALRPTQLAILGLLALAAVTGRRAPLLFVPAAIQLGLAGYFLASLRRGDSVVERMAHFMQPYLPDWIRPYCRVVTVLWAIFFLGNAVAIAWLASETDPARWKAWTGAGLYVTAFVLQGIETLFRKTWFRAFDEGPIDRLFARLFPPERTPRGRRSMEYIRRMRIELGMEEP